MATKGNIPPRRKAAKKSPAVRTKAAEETASTATASTATTAPANNTDRKKTAKKKAAAKKAVAKKTATTNKAAAAKKTPAKKAASPAPKASDTAASNFISQDERREMIATMAYYLAEKHGFQPDRDQQNWLECEQMVDEILAKKGIGTK
jgi:hypothetical protein